MPRAATRCNATMHRSIGGYDRNSPLNGSAGAGALDAAPVEQKRAGRATRNLANNSGLDPTLSDGKMDVSLILSQGCKSVSPVVLFLNVAVPPPPPERSDHTPSRVDLPDP